MAIINNAMSATLETLSRLQPGSLSHIVIVSPIIAGAEQDIATAKPQGDD